MVMNMKISEQRVGTILTDSGGHRFIVAEKESPDYEGVVLVSERLVAIMPMDKPKDVYEDSERKRCGSNDYFRSELHKWLNSEEGFFNELSEELKDSILTCNVPYAGMSDGPETFEARIFIPSCEELGLEIPDHVKEGHRLSLFREFRRRYAFPEKKLVENRPEGFRVLDENDTWCYWLRSSHPLHGSVQYTSHSHSPYALCEAFRDYVGVRCMFAVKADMETAGEEKGGCN